MSQESQTDSVLSTEPNVGLHLTTLRSRPEPKSSQICEKMLKKGIILRDLKSYALNAVRITIGQAWQNDRVFEELKQILK